MGFFGRQWRNVKSYTTRNAGTIARTTVVATVGVVASATPCGPVCGALAAAGTDALIGGPVERNAKRVAAGTVDTVEDWLSGSDGAEGPQLVSEIGGTYSTTRSIGTDDEQVSRFVVPVEPVDDGPKAKPILYGLAAAGAIYGIYRAVKGGK